jgi:hypothetical protein
VKQGEFVQFANYLGKPIIWKVVGVESDGTALLISDKIITIKAYDAATSVQSTGPARTPSLLTWLNSQDDRVNWTGSTAPVGSILAGKNAYDTEVGFLSKANFQAEELKFLAPFIDKTVAGQGNLVTILSSTQASQLVQDDLIAVPTESAVVQSNNGGWTTANLASNKPYSYWTSSPSGTNMVVVDEQGTLSTENSIVANDGRVGVRPAIRMQVSQIPKNQISNNGKSETTPYIIENK